MCPKSGHTVSFCRRARPHPLGGLINRLLAENSAFHPKMAAMALTVPRGGYKLTHIKRLCVGTATTLEHPGKVSLIMLRDDNRANGPAHGSADSTSTTLVKQAKLNQGDAWDRLTQLYTPLIYRWCRGANLRPADAADVTQEVLRTLSVRLADFDHDQPGASFRGWLRAITRNKIGDQLRRLRGQPQARGGTDAQRALSELPATDEPSSADDLATECGLLLRGALELVRAEFEPRTWRAFG